MPKSLFLTREEARDVYQKRAGIYELAVYLYSLLGFHIGRYRQLVVEALTPQSGNPGLNEGSSRISAQPRTQSGHNGIRIEVVQRPKRASIRSNAVLMTSSSTQ